MLETIPNYSAAAAPVNLANYAPSQLAQYSMDFGTPYIVNTNPATSAPYIPGRTPPYNPTGRETNPFVTPSTPANAPNTINVPSVTSPDLLCNQWEQKIF